MSEGKFQMFENRFVKVYKHKSKQAKQANVSCYRIYDHDLPEFPFCVELYENKVYLAEYLRRHGMSEEEHDKWLQKCEIIISSILSVPVDKIFLRQRNRKFGRQGQYQKLSEEKQFFTVAESGLKFLVNLTDYLDTGLFLDHRITRQMVREESMEKRVLNLFCYTGSFSVYAAAGGAASVSSVDLSKTYLQWAQDNFAINRLKDKSKYHFIHADVKRYLQTLNPDSFDLVVIDPPTFSNSKRMKEFFDIQRDHTELLNKILYTIPERGVIYFSTNYSKFALDAHNINASEIKDITKATTPFDFEGKLKRWCYKIVK